MKIKEIVSALERSVPLPLQNGFDDAGLQVGLIEVEAAEALLCLDVTKAVLDEAIALGYSLVISHHPLIFKGYKSAMGRDYVGRCILRAIKNDIIIYSAYTNLDNTQGRVSYKIAEKIGLKSLRALEPKENNLVKLATFVSDVQADNVREALLTAGCGNIDNCDIYSYSLKGEGTLRAKGGAHPFCGAIGELHHESEVRIETIFPIYKKAEVIKALLSVHPYEGPAFDLYLLQNDWSRVGSGVVGRLDESETGFELLKYIKKIFKVGYVRHNKLAGREVQKVTLRGGAGAFLLPRAIRTGADVFITGEIRCHDYFDHEDDTLMVEIGHYEGEQYTKEIFYSIIRGLSPNFTLRSSKINTNPIKYL